MSIERTEALLAGIYVRPTSTKVHPLHPSSVFKGMDYLGIKRIYLYKETDGSVQIYVDAEYAAMAIDFCKVAGIVNGKGEALKLKPCVGPSYDLGSCYMSDAAFQELESN